MSPATYEGCEKIYNQLQTFKPAMQEAFLVVQKQMNQVNLKKVEIQITPEENKVLDDSLKKLNKNYDYIKKILLEISKPLTKLLDEYKLEKCYSSLIRCIEYCHTEKVIYDAI